MMFAPGRATPDSRITGLLERGMLEMEPSAISEALEHTTAVLGKARSGLSTGLYSLEIAWGR